MRISAASNNVQKMSKISSSRRSPILHGSLNIALNLSKMSFNSRTMLLSGSLMIYCPAHMNDVHRSLLPFWHSPGVLNFMKTSNARLFTVSSIFCLFESTLSTNNFGVLNSDKKTNKDSQDNKIYTLMNNISAYLKELEAIGDPAVPSPDNLYLARDSRKTAKTYRISIETRRGKIQLPTLSLQHLSSLPPWHEGQNNWY